MSPGLSGTETLRLAGQATIRTAARYFIPLIPILLPMPFRRFFFAAFLRRFFLCFFAAFFFAVFLAFFAPFFLAFFLVVFLAFFAALRFFFFLATLRFFTAIAITSFPGNDVFSLRAVWGLFCRRLRGPVHRQA